MCVPVRMCVCSDSNGPWNGCFYLTGIDLVAHGKVSGLQVQLSSWIEVQYLHHMDVIISTVLLSRHKVALTRMLSG